MTVVHKMVKKKWLQRDLDMESNTNIDMESGEESNDESNSSADESDDQSNAGAKEDSITGMDSKSNEMTENDEDHIIPEVRTICIVTKILTVEHRENGSTRILYSLPSKIDLK